MREFVQIQFQTAVIIFLPFLSQLVQITAALRCHDCTNLQGGESFEAGCSAKTAGVNNGQDALKGGYAGCLKVVVVSDEGEQGIIRAGYFNKQMEGRVLSCYHPEPDFKVSSHVEKITFASMKSCHACDDQDGCNDGHNLTPGRWNWLLLLFLGSFVFCLNRLVTSV